MRALHTELRPQSLTRLGSTMTIGGSPARLSGVRTRAQKYGILDRYAMQSRFLERRAPTLLATTLNTKPNVFLLKRPLLGRTLAAKLPILCTSHAATSHIRI